MCELRDIRLEITETARTLIKSFSAELVLKQEQEEYQREGIAWQHIEYFNNQIICELVEQTHKGIIAIMDEACLNVGKVTDEVSGKSRFPRSKLVNECER